MTIAGSEPNQENDLQKYPSSRLLVYSKAGEVPLGIYLGLSPHKAGTDIMIAMEGGTVIHRDSDTVLIKPESTKPSAYLHLCAECGYEHIAP